MGFRDGLQFRDMYLSINALCRGMASPESLLLLVRKVWDALLASFPVLWKRALARRIFVACGTTTLIYTDVLSILVNGLCERDNRAGVNALF